MLNFPRWKVWSITLTCLIVMLLAVPSMMPEERRNELFPASIAAIHINLGLDLAGGSHLLLEAETGDLSRQRLETMEDLMRREMRTAGIRVENFSTQNDQLAMRLADPNQLGEARAVALRQTQPVGFGSQQDWNISADNGQLIMAPPRPGSKTPSRRRWRSPATSSTDESTRSVRSSRRSFARAPIAS
jgi:preprotein translocase subunit SecD